MCEIGQQVVCVESQKNGAVIEGNTYTIKAMKVYCDGKLVLDVGIPSCSNTWTDGVNIAIGEKYKCDVCNKIHANDGVWWLRASRFRPLDDLLNTEIADLMEEVNQKQPFKL